MPNDTDWHGESGYVNCLLTTLSEGPRSEIGIAGCEHVPSLVELAKGNDDLYQWASKLTFDYKSLNSRLIIAMLLHLAGFRWYSWFKRRGAVQSVLAKEDGAAVVQSIVIERRQRVGGEVAVHVSVRSSGG